MNDLELLVFSLLRATSGYWHKQLQLISKALKVLYPDTIGPYPCTWLERGRYGEQFIFIRANNQLVYFSVDNTDIICLELKKDRNIPDTAAYLKLRYS